MIGLFRNKIYRLLIGSVLLGLLILLAYIFIPRHQNINSNAEPTGTHYWNLSTGSNIAYTALKASQPNKETAIIYLHGGPGGRIMNQQIEVLRPLSDIGYDVYLYDQIGSGYSARLDHINDYTVKRHRDDLLEIIKKIQAKEVILIGHSWGCLLATAFIQEHPKKIKQLIFSGPGPILPIRYDLAHKVAPDSLGIKQPPFTNKELNQGLQNLRTLLTKKVAYRLGKKLLSDKEMDADFAQVCKRLSKSTNCEGQEATNTLYGVGYYAHIMTVKSFDQVPDQRSVLSQCTIPLLIIKGECDNQAWGFTEEYLKLFRNSELKIVKGCGHDVLHEHSTEYVSLIQAFLAGKK